MYSTLTVNVVQVICFFQSLLVKFKKKKTKANIIAKTYMGKIGRHGF